MKQTCSTNLTDSKSRIVCSTNLTKHLKLLKDECNKLVTLQQNGYKVPIEDVTVYLQHKQYVRTLLHTEKMKQFDKELKQTCKSI